MAREDLPLERVYRWERERAEHPFLTQPFRGRVLHWTWAQAMNEARRIATYLRAQNWAPGSRIGILSKNCAWWIMSDLATWMAGHVSVPVYPALHAKSVGQILDHSGAVACFLGATEGSYSPGTSAPAQFQWIAFPNAAETGGACPVGKWQDLVRGNEPLAGRPYRGPNDLATIMYTSGTTGTPKGVMHRFGGLAANAAILADTLHLGSGHRVLSYLPLAHIVERAGVETTTYLLGWHLFFSESLETFVDDLRRARPTLFVSVPRLLSKFQEGVYNAIPKGRLERMLRIPGVRTYVKRSVLRKLGIDTVKFAACGAAPLAPDLLLWYRMLGLELVEGYGMTETMITHLPRMGEVLPGYVGRALDGVETRLGPQGELLIRSPMNMLGYYREPAMTAAAFTEDGYFKTGDLVALDSSGQLRIVGRIKEQFKTSKGKYVAPAPIEARLLTHPALDACCIMGSGRPSPFAVVTLSDGIRKRCADAELRRAAEESLVLLMESVNQTLESFERLSMIVIADGPWTIANGLITPTLKLRRTLLEDCYEQKMDEWQARGTPIVWESPPEPFRAASIH